MLQNLTVGILSLIVLCSVAEAKKSNRAPEVLLQTSLGNIKIRLNQEKAPVSTQNMLTYVKAGLYNGTIFHRVIKGFMIQGGGFTPDLKRKPTHDPILNEADNGLSNKRGTVAMARTSVINSATAQFFINTVDNIQLDHQGPGAAFGYAVIGEVIEGMSVVDKISELTTCPGAPDCPPTLPPGMRDVPTKPVLIIKAKQIK